MGVLIEEFIEIADVLISFGERTGEDDMAKSLYVIVADTKSVFSWDSTVSSFFDLEIVRSCAVTCNMYSLEFGYWLIVCVLL